MKTVPATVVREVLRQQLGLRPVARGNATGHEVWGDQHGRTCRPVLRKKAVPYAALFSLGKELENQGIVSRRAFLTALRTA
jgi:hypothetical protein